MKIRVILSSRFSFVVVIGSNSGGPSNDSGLDIQPRRNLSVLLWETNCPMSINSRPRQSESGFLERPLIQEMYLSKGRRILQSWHSLIAAACMDLKVGIRNKLHKTDSGFMFHFIKYIRF
jgi:hypothetical protein